MATDCAGQGAAAPNEGPSSLNPTRHGLAGGRKPEAQVREAVVSGTPIDLGDRLKRAQRWLTVE
jgi:hypothetical protein